MKLKDLPEEDSMWEGVEVLSHLTLGFLEGKKL